MQNLNQTISLNSSSQSFQVQKIQDDILKYPDNTQKADSKFKSLPLKNDLDPNLSLQSVTKFGFIQSSNINAIKSKIDDDFFFDDQQIFQTNKSLQNKSSYQLINSKDARSLSQKQAFNQSVSQQSLKNIWSSSANQSSFRKKEQKNSSSDNFQELYLNQIEPVQKPSSLIPKEASTSHRSLNWAAMSIQDSCYEQKLCDGEFILSNKQIVNQIHIEMMKNLDPKLKQSEMQLEVNNQQMKMTYAQKVQEERQKLNLINREQKQKRRKLYVTNILQRLKVQITEENEQKYLKHLLKARQLAQKYPCIKQKKCLFLLNLEINHAQMPIDRNFFNQLKTWPKQLIYEMVIGPHLTQKMVENIFRHEWPNLRRVVFHRSVRQKIETKETIYFVTENKNNFEFLQQFKQRNQLEFIAVAGNYFTTLMANTLFIHTFTSLKQLVIDYDAVLSKQNFEVLLQTKPFNFDNSDVIIYLNKKQYEDLKPLVNDYFNEYRKQINSIRFLDRKDQLQNRPYTRQLKDINSQDEMQEEEFSSQKNESQIYQIIPNDVSFDSFIADLENPDIGKDLKLDSVIQDEFFYDSNIEPVVIAGHMSGIFDQQFEFQTIEDFNRLMRDLEFSNKYQRYNQAMKSTKLLQFKHFQISQELNGIEEDTDVFILDFTKEQCFADPFDQQYLQQMKGWDRFLFTTIAIDYRYHQPSIINKIFQLEWQNLKSLCLQNITYRSFCNVATKGQQYMQKVKCPKVKLEMLKDHKLNERLTALSLSGERMPKYLAMDFTEIDFPNLEELTLLFVKKMKTEVVNILTCTLFGNLNSKCQIAIHSYQGESDERFYQALTQYSCSLDKQQTQAYWKERVIFIDYYQEEFDRNKTDYKQGYKSSQDEIYQEEIDKLNGFT